MVCSKNSLRLKIGSLFLVALEGKTLTEEEKEALSLFGLKHFIFFSRNLGSYTETRALLQEIEALAGKGLRAIDQEGGPVCRLKPPYFPNLKAPFSLAQEKDPEKAVAKEASLCANELKRWGFNLNLAPVLDLGGEKTPSFLKGRTFGEDPKKVAVLARIYIKTFKKAGLLSCAKHFPGLGGVKNDPHYSLPVKEAIEEKDLLPFREAIKAGVPAIMTTHLLIPSWDEAPVTFSPKLVSFLRRKLHFKGLILTDDLFMGGALEMANLEEAVLRAFLSGHDLLLLCGSFQESLKVLSNFADESAKSTILLEKLFQKKDFIEKQICTLFSKSIT